MPYDKLCDSAVLDANLATVADAIRKKGGTTGELAFPDGFVSAVKALTGAFTKIGEMTVTYTATSIDCKSYEGWENLTVDNFYLNPLNFQVFSTDGATTGTITCGTYAFSKKYSNGVFTAARASVSGKVGLKFDCEIYIYDPKG